MQARLGFSLVEMLIVIAIIVTILGVLVTGFQNYARYQALRATVASVALTLTEVQANAKVALNDDHHGFRVDSDRITMFQGSVYNVLDPNNQVVVFDDVTLTPSFNGGVIEVRLNKVSGIPTATGTIAVTGVRYPETRIITLTDAGVLYYE